MIAPFLRLSRLALAGAVAVLLAGACDDDVQGPPDAGPDDPSPELLSTLIVSNPVTSAAVAAGAGLSLGGSSSSTEIVYTSLPPGTFPDGERAIIRPRGTGAETTALMVAGGFDPVPVAAAAGDTLDISIELAGGGPPLAFLGVVPPSRPPVIVRTEPPPKKRDVPLNAVMLVVFSEPISAAALTASSAQLLLDGEPVAGTLGFGDGEHLTVTFTPAEPLTPGAEYVLVITRAIEDLDGDALAEELRIDFTTATASATSTFAQLSAGDNHTCGVTTDNVAYCWGFDFFGQLGVGAAVAVSTPFPTRVAGSLSFARVSAGGGRTCGVTTGGAAYCWGLNEGGQLGDGTSITGDETFISRAIPTPVAGNLTFAQVSPPFDLFGGASTSGVTTDGAAYCWAQCDGILDSTPTPVRGAGGLSFAQVSTGDGHTCGVTNDHVAYCWGENFQGEFGDGTIDAEGGQPARPVGGDLSFAQVSAGFHSTCGVTTEGSAYCWGLNSVGQLGDGTTDSRLTPTPVAGGLSFAQVSAGSIHTCGVTTEGLAYCWGPNDEGQLGDGTTDTRFTPTPVAGDLSFAQVTAGGDHTCGVTTDGLAYCWGRNFSGQLGSQFGYGSPGGNRLAPTPVEPIP